MSDIPRFPYRLLWGERRLLSVANLTRSDAAGFFSVVRSAQVATTVQSYALERANEAISDLRAGRVRGAAVLTC
jgi:propanol-preferring alcohol dehydrogenase